VRSPRTLVVAILVAATACGGGGESSPPDAAPAPDAASSPDATVDAGPVERPTKLSQTGLYSDFAARTVAPGHQEFTPAYVLWSDGAVKHRWLKLPPGGSIDKSDPDHWLFPIGTRLFKEFASPDGKRLETRLIERTGPGAMDYWMGSFVWNDDETEATFKVDGAEDIRGTDHDAPAQQMCWSCHVGEPGRILGNSAVQLGATAPGPPEVAAALGYLHANCGHCHSDTGVARPDTDQILRLSVAETTPESTRIYQTTIGKVLSIYRDPSGEVYYRVAPGDPEHSGIFVRPSVRGDKRQMPPIATEHPDEAGLGILRDWIENL